MFTAQQIANWLLTQQSMSPKKLQKMLYYSYVWVLTLNNDDSENLDNRLFEESFEAWVHGPVIRSIYEKYRSFGYNDIVSENSKDVEIGEDVLDTLKQVMEIYGGYNGNELESITHQEKPWIEARADFGPLDACSVEISDKTIYETYIARLN